MTYEESRKYLLQNFFDGDEDVRAVSNGDEETLVMKKAIEALELQIPKKPIEFKTWDTTGLYNFICPTCKKPILRYCRCSNEKCCQMIDWSENLWQE